tara:strand:+ start:40 stop:381 length:342 start_codon:yes stop_codon:yes gene_type:complete
MKFVKTVKIKSGKAQGDYQIGQYGMDEFGNQYRLMTKATKSGSIGSYYYEEGENVWHCTSDGQKAIKRSLTRILRIKACKIKSSHTLKTKVKYQMIHNQDGNLVRNGGSSFIY